MHRHSTVERFKLIVLLTAAAVAASFVVSGMRSAAPRTPQSSSKEARHGANSTAKIEVTSKDVKRRELSAGASGWLTHRAGVLEASLFAGFGLIVLALGWRAKHPHFVTARRRVEDEDSSRS